MDGVHRAGAGLVEWLLAAGRDSVRRLAGTHLFSNAMMPPPTTAPYSHILLKAPAGVAKARCGHLRCDVAVRAGQTKGTPAHVMVGGRVTVAGGKRGAGWQ